MVLAATQRLTRLPSCHIKKRKTSNKTNSYAEMSKEIDVEKEEISDEKDNEKQTQNDSLEKQDDDEFVVHLEDTVGKSPVFEERLEFASKRKTEGNELFKTDKFEDALKVYRYGLFHSFFDEMSFNFELMDQHRSQVNDIRLPLLLNALQCVNKIIEHDIGHDREELKKLGSHLAKEAIKVDAKNVKALYRRAYFFLLLKEFEKSKKDLEKAVSIDPQNSVVRHLFNVVIQCLKKQEKLDKERWKKVLDKEFVSNVKHSDVSVDEQKSAGHEIVEDIKLDCCSWIVSRVRDLYSKPKFA